MNNIAVSAIVVRDEAGRVLTVRKQGTDLFMFPGGKLEPGESALDAAEREAFEELGVRVSDLSYLGSFTAPAANEAGFTVSAEVFTGLIMEDPAPTSEIEEIAWVHPDKPAVALAPLLADHVFPILRPSVQAATVFCASAHGNSPAFASMASELGSTLANNGIDLVYGGGKVGLMGSVADAAVVAGGTTWGIITEDLAEKELAHPGLTHLEVVTTMHQRKARMAELGDAFIALPGGAGTLEELFEAWVWQILGIHHKPVALYGHDFWAPLLTMLETMARQGFIAQEFVDSLIVADNPVELLRLIQNWQPPKPKWG